MKKMKTKNKCLVTSLAIIAMLMMSLGVKAQQRVHIGLDNGSLLNAYASDDDLTDSGWGFSALWRHEQLSLSVTGSDRDGLLESGEPSIPSTVFGKHWVTENGKQVQKMTIVGGRRPSYIVVSLPKGYRILSYKMVLVNDLAPNDYYTELQSHGEDIDSKWRYINSNNTNTGQWQMGNNGQGTMRFYETAPWETNGTNSGTKNNPNWNRQERDRNTYDEDGDGYNASRVRNITPGSDWPGNEIGSAGLPNTDKDYIVQAVDASGNGNIYSNDRGSNKVFTIQRTGQQTGVDANGVPTYDMGNQLYFRLVKDYYGYGLTIKSFEITFNAEGTFEADIVPEDVGAAQSVVTTPFETSKTDIGTMGVEVKEGRAFFSYNYNHVKDLIAYNYLYQESAVPKEGDANLGDHTVGVPVENYAAEKHIRPVQVTAAGKSQLLYALGSDTYYIEPPIEIETQTTNEETGEKYKAPIGYRIVGALFTPLWGQQATGYSPGAYTLKIWKHDGSEVLHTIEISDANDADLNQVYDVGMCNNDAIKFQIVAADGKQALVHVKLLLQALDPYIEKMDIVCTDETNVLQLTQSFTADDFSVSGGKFIFYVPEDYRNNVLTFTFSDLYTKYGDETYYGGSIGTSRYSYVTSDYFKKYSGNQNPAGAAYDFPVNGGLYDPLYKNGKGAIEGVHYTQEEIDAAEEGDDAYGKTTEDWKVEPKEAIPAGPNYPYDTKVYTATAGNIRFKFNNAEDLAAQGIADEDFTGSLIEYPFTVTDYIGSSDPDNKTTETGRFKSCVLMANPAEGYQNTGTFFVFTADETRWNIAPTTAWQHRFYAFYRMEIEALAKSFLPKYTWTKIYDETCYYDDDENNETAPDAFDPMWGVSIKATDVETGDVLPEGYLTYQEIIDYITLDHDPTTYSADEAAAYNAEHNLTSDTQQGYKKAGDPRTPFIAKQLDPTGVNAPKSMDQILYVDGSELYAMVNSSTKQDDHGQIIVITLNDLKKLLSTNNLVFLPEGTIEKVDNAAYKVASGFQAGKDIVLTDKKPFFSPYDISVGADNVATYTRLITVPQNGKVINATVMLPFTLRLENGKHTNLDDNFAFTVNTMNSSEMQDMTPQGDSYVDYGTAYFAAIGKAEEEGQTNVTWTKANVPYMINVTADDNTSGDKISFIATQKGSDIVATPKVGTAGMKEMVGESATGSFGGNTYSFTNYGSYSGVRYDRVDSEDIFYFANNMYLNLHTLNPSKRYLYSYPFRAVYKYTTSSSSGTGTTGGAKLMRGFDISYDDIIPFSGIATDIAAQDTQADLIVKIGRGSVTMTASRAQDVNINTLSGMNMKRVDLNAGDTKTVNLPAGIYVINNVKVIVK